MGCCGFRVELKEEAFESGKNALLSFHDISGAAAVKPGRSARVCLEVAAGVMLPVSPALGS
jgi:hypothetical protein